MRIRFKMTVGEILRQLKEMYLNTVDEMLAQGQWTEEDAAEKWKDIHATNLSGQSVVQLIGWVESFSAGEHFGYEKCASVDVGNLREVFPKGDLGESYFLFVKHDDILEVLK